MRMLIVGLTCLLAICTSSRAAFVGGVETFNGTSLDSSTWFTSTGNTGAFFTQNNALTLNTYEPTTGMAIAAYTTLMPLVPVGGAARVEATINRVNNVFPRSGQINFELTSDSNGIVGPIAASDYTLSVN